MKLTSIFSVSVLFNAQNIFTVYQQMSSGQNWHFLPTVLALLKTRDTVCLGANFKVCVMSRQRANVKFKRSPPTELDFFFSFVAYMTNIKSCLSLQMKYRQSGTVRSRICFQIINDGIWQAIIKMGPKRGRSMTDLQQHFNVGMSGLHPLCSSSPVYKKQAQRRAFTDLRYHHSNIIYLLNSCSPLMKSHFYFQTLIFVIQVIKYFNTVSHFTLLLHLSGNCDSGVRREMII